jgi:hypothetical protein
MIFYWCICTLAHLADGCSGCVEKSLESGELTSGVNPSTKNRNASMERASMARESTVSAFIELFPQAPRACQFENHYKLRDRQQLLRKKSVSVIDNTRESLQPGATLFEKF